MGLHLPVSLCVGRCCVWVCGCEGMGTVCRSVLCVGVWVCGCEDMGTVCRSVLCVGVWV